MDTINEIKQFRTAVGDGALPHPFQIDNDTFYAAARLPGGAVLDLAGIIVTAEDGSQTVRAGALMEFLDAVLLPDSAQRFADRLRSPTEPIGLDEATGIVKWLVEEVYGLRPTVRLPS